MFDDLLALEPCPAALLQAVGGAADERPRLRFRREFLVPRAGPAVDLAQAHEPVTVDSWRATDADCHAYVETVRSGSEGENSA